MLSKINNKMKLENKYKQVQPFSYYGFAAISKKVMCNNIWMDIGYV